MHKHLMLLAVAATLGAFAAPVLAMTEGEYKAERDNLEKSYSDAQLSCDALLGSAKGECQDRVRSQKKIAMDKLEAGYKAEVESRAQAKANR